MFGNVFALRKNPVLLDIFVGQVRVQRRANGQFAGFPSRLDHPQIVDVESAAKRAEHQSHRRRALALTFARYRFEKRPV